MNSYSTSNKKVIIVLGAPTTNNGQPGPDLKARLDRCMELLATEPYSDSTVVVTGGSPNTYGSAGVHSEGEIMRSYLVAKGADQHTTTILVEDQALHTFHNALYSKTLLRAHGVHFDTEALLELTIITTDWHMERSLLCFEAVFADAPEVTLTAESVSSGITVNETMKRISKEKKILEQGWIAQCIQEEKHHPDMPDQHNKR